MKPFAIRLKPNHDLKKELASFSKEKKIRAGIILMCVGSLKKATLRLADENVGTTFDEKFEIVSLGGTLSPDGNHIHVSLSNNKGETIGGHLLEGCVIYTTAEIVIAECVEFSFSREYDEQTGFKELKITSR